MRWRSTWITLRTRLSYFKLRWSLGKRLRRNFKDKLKLHKTNYRLLKKARIVRSKTCPASSLKVQPGSKNRCKSHKNLKDNSTWPNGTIAIRKRAQWIILESTSRQNTAASILQSPCKKTKNILHLLIMAQKRRQPSKFTKRVNRQTTSKIRLWWRIKRMCTRPWQHRKVYSKNNLLTQAWTLHNGTRIAVRKEVLYHRRARSTCHHRFLPLFITTSQQVRWCVYSRKTPHRTSNYWDKVVSFQIQPMAILTIRTFSSRPAATWLPQILTP